MAIKGKIYLHVGGQPIGTINAEQFAKLTQQPQTQKKRKFMASFQELVNVLTSNKIELNRIKAELEETKRLQAAQKFALDFYKTQSEGRFAMFEIKDKQVEILKAENDRLKWQTEGRLEAIKARNAEHMKDSEQIRTLTAENEQLKKENREMYTQLKQPNKSAVNHEARNAYNKLQAEREDLNNKVAAYEYLNNYHKSVADNYGKQLKSLKAENEIIKAANERGRKADDLLRAENISLKDSLKDLIKENERLEILFKSDCNTALKAKYTALVEARSCHDCDACYWLTKAAKC